MEGCAWGIEELAYEQVNLGSHTETPKVPKSPIEEPRVSSTLAFQGWRYKSDHV